MATPHDALATPESQSYAGAPPVLPPMGEDLGPISLFQEINERRARVENAELLQHLRGL